MNKIHEGRGQSLVEYALLVALVCLAAMMFFIPTIIVYQWMRHVRHADRTTSFLFAIGFTALMNMAAHRAGHLRLRHHHECCDGEEEPDFPNPGCECCEFDCVCPAGAGCCRCGREGDRDCCGRTGITRCDCGGDCDCYGGDKECDCGDDCNCCCNQRRIQAGLDRYGPDAARRGERPSEYGGARPPEDDLGKEQTVASPA